MRRGMEWDPWYHEMCITVGKRVSVYLDKLVLY